MRGVRGQELGVRGQGSGVSPRLTYSAIADNPEGGQAVRVIVNQLKGYPKSFCV